MVNRKFYQITEGEFININHVVSISLKEEEILLFFVGGEEKSYKLSDLTTQFNNFIQIKLL
jgi:hypothetical protein|tara:strand:- start:21 stop:203 length:183 start_codon:yes stop_codon:yes gene_type:complete